MTKEMKHELKMKFLRETKEKSVSCLRAMGADSKDFEPCSWEGVMTMLSDVMRHSTYDKASAAIMAASAWVWANKECEIRESIAQMDEMLVKEIEAAQYLLAAICRSRYRSLSWISCTSFLRLKRSNDRRRIFNGAGTTDTERAADDRP